MVNLTDLPNDILLLIFSMVEGDIKDNPFIYLSKNLHMSIKDYNYLHYTSILYTEYCMKNPYLCILPYSLSRLECVCKVFSEVASQMWEPMFVEHIRGGKPYKYPRGYNYKKKYYSKLIPYYKKHMDFNLKESVISQQMYHIKSNNSSVYMKYIQQAIDRTTMDNSDVVYRVKDLYTRHGDSVNVITLGLKFDTLIQYRRRSIFQMDQYKARSRMAHRKHETYKRTYESLKNY